MVYRGGGGRTSTRPSCIPHTDYNPVQNAAALSDSRPNTLPPLVPMCKLRPVAARRAWHHSEEHKNFSQPEAQLIIYHSRTVELTLTKFKKSASQLTEWNFDVSRVSIDTFPSIRPLPNRSLRRNVAPTALSAFGFFPSLFNLFTSAQLTQTSGKSVFGLLS